jgi:hypothetical protein
MSEVYLVLIFLIRENSMKCDNKTVRIILSKSTGTANTYFTAFEIPWDLRAYEEYVKEYGEYIIAQKDVTITEGETLS